MKKIYSVILLSALLYSANLHAQETKLSISLSRYIDNASRNSSRSAENIPVLVKGDVTQIRSYCNSHGGVFKYAVANKYASVILPASTIKDFSQAAFVKRVEGIYHPARAMSDSVGCHQSYVFPVHNDTSILTRGYLGDSVVVGIIDAGGFYFQHKDFRQTTDTTKTRFLFLWDQTVNGNPPSDFNYGTQWDAAEINNGVCTETDNTGHGTNCLGNMAGNGQAFSPSVAYMGVAPQSNIIGVKFIGGQYWETYVVDAANYIYAKADSLNEPCVINLSFGTYQGSHDGQDLATQMLDSLITEHAGHSFVTACGDGGPGEYYPFHLGYTATSDSLFTWFSPTNGYAEAFEFWIDTNQSGNFNFAIGVDNPAKWEYLGRDIFLGIDTFIKYKANGYANKVENSKGKVIFYDTVIAEQVANAYHFVCYIGTDSLSYYFRLITKGSGRFDLWSNEALTSTWQMGSHAYQAYLPTVSQFPDFVRYVYPDSFQSICSDFQCSPNIISVANYTNRTSWVECTGPTYTSSGETEGDLSVGSSWGPTRDGRIEPDITAPGDETIAPGDATIIGELLGGGGPFKVAKGCVYDRNGGTSLSAPFVAGVAALYLQEYPNATWKEVKAAIDSCAYKDSFTGATPISYEWGYGKIDALCTMQDIPTGIEKPVPTNVSLTNYPNPFNNYTNIVYNTGNMGFQSAEIDVYNMIGQKISAMPLHSASGTLQFNNSNLTQGMYIYKLVVNQKSLAAGKFIILY